MSHHAPVPMSDEQHQQNEVEDAKKSRANAEKLLKFTHRPEQSSNLMRCDAVCVCVCVSVCLCLCVRVRVRDRQLIYSACVL